MTESFDPYRQWLGIEESNRPLDHYQLLGLPRFESDPQQIAHAADIAMAKVRKIRPGEHIADWGRLLDQISAVKVCLLDPSSRAAYDYALRTGGGATLAVPPGTVPPTASPQTVVPPTSAPAGPAAPSPPAGSSLSTEMPTAAQADSVTGSAMQPGPASSQLPPLSSAFPGAASVPGGGAVPGGAAPRAESPWSSNPVSMKPTGGQPSQESPQPVPVATAVAKSVPSTVPSSGQVSSGPPPGQSVPTSFPAGSAPGAFPGSTASTMETRPRRWSVQQQVTTAATTLLSAVVIVLIVILMTQDRGEQAPQIPATSSPEVTPERRPQDSPATPPTSPDPPASSADPVAPNTPSDLVTPAPAPTASSGSSKPPATPSEEQEASPAAAPSSEAGTTNNGIGMGEPSEPAESQEPKTEQPPATPPGQMSEPPAEPAGSDPMMGQSLPSDPEASPIDPIEAPTTPSPAPSSNMPANNASFETALSNARFSMSERDLTGARTHLELARKVAKTDQQKYAVDRVGIVLDHLEEFWRGMHKAAASLQSGKELPVKDTVVVVVESGPDVLTIRSAGRNLDYRVEELPGALVLAVADSWFDKSGASELLIGTFLCFDGKGHADMGRNRLQKAVAAGVDVKLFLEELKAGGSGTDFEKTRTGTGPRGNAPRSPQIDPEMLRQAKETVRKKFAADIAAARTPAAKQALALKLLQQAQHVADTPDVQVVMIQEAQRLAIESGQVELALQSIAALVGLGVASPVALKIDAFEQLAKTVRGGDARQIAQAALQMIPKAIEARDRANATRLAEVALAAARNSNSAVLMRQAMAAKLQLQAKP